MSEPHETSKEPTQKKKIPTDPDFDRINPTIIAIARRNGFVQQPIQLYLHGDLTWQEALETMVCAIGREFTSQREMVAALASENLSALSNHQPIALLLHDIKKKEDRQKRKAKKNRKKRDRWRKNWTYQI